jgi:hypothetical protein
MAFPLNRVIVICDIDPDPTEKEVEPFSDGRGIPFFSGREILRLRPIIRNSRRNLPS